MLTGNTVNEGVVDIVCDPVRDFDCVEDGAGIVEVWVVDAPMLSVWLGDEVTEGDTELQNPYKT